MIKVSAIVKIGSVYPTPNMNRREKDYERKLLRCLDRVGGSKKFVEQELVLTPLMR